MQVLAEDMRRDYWCRKCDSPAKHEIRAGAAYVHPCRCGRFPWEIDGDRLLKQEADSAS